MKLSTVICLINLSVNFIRFAQNFQARKNYVIFYQFPISYISIHIQHLMRFDHVIFIHNINCANWANFILIIAHICCDFVFSFEIHGNCAIRQFYWNSLLFRLHEFLWTFIFTHTHRHKSNGLLSHNDAWFFSFSLSVFSWHLKSISLLFQPIYVNCFQQRKQRWIKQIRKFDNADARDSSDFF